MKWLGEVDGVFFNDTKEGARRALWVEAVPFF